MRRRSFLADWQTFLEFLLICRTTFCCPCWMDIGLGILFLKKGKHIVQGNLIYISIVVFGVPIKPNIPCLLAWFSEQWVFAHLPNDPSPLSVLIHSLLCISFWVFFWLTRWCWRIEELVTTFLKQFVRVFNSGGFENLCISLRRILVGVYNVHSLRPIDTLGFFFCISHFLPSWKPNDF